MDYLAELKRRSVTLKRQQASADATRAEMFDLIREALTNGVSQAEIARTIGYSRERLRVIAQGKG